MKKTFVLGCLSLALSNSILNASESVRSIIGVTGGSIIYDNKSQAGTIGVKAEVQKQLINGLYFGVGVNTDFFKKQYPDYLGSTNTDSNLGVAVDFYPVVSISLTNNISINGLYGYTVGQLGSKSFDGTTYGFGLNYRITKNWETGFNYKSTKLEFEHTNYDLDVDRYSAGISYRF